MQEKLSFCRKLMTQNLFFHLSGLGLNFRCAQIICMSHCHITFCSILISDTLLLILTSLSMPFFVQNGPKIIFFFYFYFFFCHSSTPYTYISSHNIKKKLKIGWILNMLILKHIVGIFLLKTLMTHRSICFN